MCIAIMSITITITLSALPTQSTLSISYHYTAFIQATKLEQEENLKEVPSRQAFSQSNACF